MSKKSTERAATRKSSGGYVSVPQSYGVRAAGGEHEVSVRDDSLYIDVVKRTGRPTSHTFTRFIVSHKSRCPHCNVMYDKDRHLPECPRGESQQRSRALLYSIDMSSCLPGVKATINDLDGNTFTVTRYSPVPRPA